MTDETSVMQIWTFLRSRFLSMRRWPYNGLHPKLVNRDLHSLQEYSKLTKLIVLLRETGSTRSGVSICLIFFFPWTSSFLSSLMPSLSPETQSLLLKHHFSRARLGVFFTFAIRAVVMVVIFVLYFTS